MSNGVRAPVRFLVLFVLSAGIPLAALVWTGWRLLDQDRAQGAEQLQERLNNAANVAVRELDRGLSRLEERLPAASQGDSTVIPPEATVLVFDSRGIVARYGAALPYYPRIAPRPEADAGTFTDAESKEFRDENLAQAAALYRKLAQTRDPRIRAGALMRLARCLSNQQLFDEALKAYNELAGMADIPVGGDPAELVARRYRIALFDKKGDASAKIREAALLESALTEGRFIINRTAFESYAESLPHSAASRAQARADAVEELWPRWQQEPAGRAVARATGGTGFVAVWRQTPAGGSALVGAVDILMAPMATAVHDFDFRVALEEPSGRIFWGSTFSDSSDDTRAIRQNLREAGLPWVLRISADGQAGRQESALRRNLLGAGLGLMALVIAAASYFVFRSLTREFRVAQLQSDFVSAVSHEFRTPLTAMRHLTDLLEEGGVLNEGLAECYSALGKETRRLHSMVENLLDFARMESGRRTYDMRNTNAAEFVGVLVDEFREQRHLRPQRIKLCPLRGDLRIKADANALSLALRNLMDNAVKYSPDSSTVTVSLEDQDGFVRISVADQGAGVARQEQAQIFRKFVRGAAAKQLNVKGTGIGLAMAQQIVNAHGGRIELASKADCGSRFTIVLPLAAGAESETVK